MGGEHNEIQIVYITRNSYKSFRNTVLVYLSSEICSYISVTYGGVGAMMPSTQVKHYDNNTIMGITIYIALCLTQSAVR